jgi:hypothetical protein
MKSMGVFGRTTGLSGPVSGPTQEASDSGSRKRAQARERSANCQHEVPVEGKQIKAV